MTNLSQSFFVAFMIFANFVMFIRFDIVVFSEVNEHSLSRLI